MRKRISILVLFVTFFIFLVVGCGGGGGDASPPPRPDLELSNLVGEYGLLGFHIYGTESPYDVTQHDVNSYMGSMNIYPDGFLKQHMRLNGYDINNEGYVEVVRGDKVEIIAGDCIVQAHMVWNENTGVLTFTLRSRSPEDICDYCWDCVEYVEDQYWAKHSDTPWPDPRLVLQHIEPSEPFSGLIEAWESLP